MRNNLRLLKTHDLPKAAEPAQPERSTSSSAPLGPRSGVEGDSVSGNKLQSSFTIPRNYEAYVNRTNEKTKLRNELARAYIQRELPVKPGEINKRILDLGCGLGSNTSVLLSLFEEHDVYALDRSNDFLEYASARLIAPNKNLIIEHKAFEDFSTRQFDFILCSHVLQYIDTPLIPFLKKIVESLSPGGEAWIVLQEDRGINDLVIAALPFLEKPSPYFSDWFVHERVRRILLTFGVEIRSRIFLSHFQTPNLSSPSADDIAMLDFILLNGFNPQNTQLVRALASAISSTDRTGLVPHEVGITKFRRLS